MNVVEVTKMSGAGNDFLVLGPVAVERVERSGLRDWVRRACRRGLSLGADGVLLVEPVAEGRVGVRFRNPDGSSAFCGNGTRCAARFAARAGLAGASMVLETEIGDVPAEVIGESVRITLPPPTDLGHLELEIAGETVAGHWIDAGVPHFVISVDAVAAAPLERWGPPLRRHPRFGEAGSNVNVVSRDAAGTVRLRTWERGVEAETLACGSGAVAVAHAERLGGAAERIDLLPSSGVPLIVELPGAAAAPRHAVLEGDARVIFEAALQPEAWTGFPS